MRPEPEDTETAATGIEAAIGHTFSNRELLRMALTHRSYSNERGEDDNYERLEFLGDAVLGLVSSHWLYERFPDQPEGELAKLKGFVVSAPVLSRHAGAIDVGARLRLGVGEKRSGGRFKASILADAMESIFGAVYLDAGLEAARRVIRPILENALAERSRISHADAKTTLQERVQGLGGGLPIYRLVKETGPDHRKLFTVECRLEGEVAGVAEGGSKKLAEQRAAAAALEKLDLPGDQP
ncbi:MAG: ribonuclease III [bacterium]|nr:ribonuclease III [bacterium]